MISAYTKHILETYILVYLSEILHSAVSAIYLCYARLYIRKGLSMIQNTTQTLFMFYVFTLLNKGRL